MDCKKSTQKVTLHFSFGGHLEFQNGRHFQHILAYFSTSELLGKLIMVAIPMLMMLRDVIKALGKLLVVIFLVAILKFKYGRHLDFKMTAVFNIFWTISQLLSYLESLKLWQYPCL